MGLNSQRRQQSLTLAADAIGWHDRGFIAHDEAGADQCIHGHLPNRVSNCRAEAEVEMLVRRQEYKVRIVLT